MYIVCPRRFRSPHGDTLTSLSVFAAYEGACHGAGGFGRVRFNPIPSTNSANANSPRSTGGANGGGGEGGGGGGAGGGGLGGGGDGGGGEGGGDGGGGDSAIGQGSGTYGQIEGAGGSGGDLSAKVGEMSPKARREGRKWCEANFVNWRTLETAYQVRGSYIYVCIYIYI